MIKSNVYNLHNGSREKLSKYQNTDRIQKTIDKFNPSCPKNIGDIAAAIQVESYMQ